MKKQLGCLSATGIITAIIVVLIITGFILAGGGTIFSPGPLNVQAGGKQLVGVKSHVDLSRRCSACHVPPWGEEIMSDRCLVCHTEIAVELQNPASLHGAMMADASLPCQACHTEHKGPNASLTVVDPHQFPHEAVGYSLQAHQDTPTGTPFTCPDCHQESIRRFDSNNCDTCHRDLDIAFTLAHVETFGRDCLACHDGVDTYGAAFDHNQMAFRLEGAHASKDCVDCHRGMYAMIDLQATSQECYACHLKDDTHLGQFGLDCTPCHVTNNWEESTFDHAVSNFLLTGAHERVECKSCHIGNVFKGIPLDCYSCHVTDDEHSGKFGVECDACHITTAWEQVTIEDHIFPLTHKNRGRPIECQVCHPNTVAAYICYGCHEHNPAEIEHKHHEEDIRDSQGCTSCHPTGQEYKGEDNDEHEDDDDD